ncbi:uncharacterized protein isoform X2 [Leptinotarsa decemlineata]
MENTNNSSNDKVYYSMGEEEKYYSSSDEEVDFSLIIDNARCSFCPEWWGFCTCTGQEEYVPPESTSFPKPKPTSDGKQETPEPPPPAASPNLSQPPTTTNTHSEDKNNKIF